MGQNLVLISLVISSCPKAQDLIALTAYMIIIINADNGYKSMHAHFFKGKQNALFFSLSARTTRSGISRNTLQMFSFS